MNPISTFTASQLGCVRETTTLFKEISFCLSSGEILMIEGSNGSGKSSLLRLLAGLATPHSGDILWQNESIYQNRDFFNEHLHYVGHANGIKLGLTVAENMELAKHLANMATLHLTKVAYSLEQDADEVLSALGLINYKHMLVKNLSAGQKRRLALTRLFLTPKKLWILDEPFTSLDKNSQAIFLSLLETHLKHEGICVMTSHDPISDHTQHQKILRLSQC